MPSFEVEVIDKTDGIVQIAIDAGFCRTFSEALLSYRERFSRDTPKGRPNPACEALGHLVQQAGFILAGENTCKYPKLADKVENFPIIQESLRDGCHEESNQVAVDTEKVSIVTELTNCRTSR